MRLSTPAFPENIIRSETRTIRLSGRPRVREGERRAQTPPHSGVSYSPSYPHSLLAKEERFDSCLSRAYHAAARFQGSDPPRSHLNSFPRQATPPSPLSFIINLQHVLSATSRQPSLDATHR